MPKELQEQALKLLQNNYMDIEKNKASRHVNLFIITNVNDVLDF